MEITTSVTIEYTHKEAMAIRDLIGATSIMGRRQLGLTEEQAYLLDGMYMVLDDAIGEEGDCE